MEGGICMTLQQDWQEESKANAVTTIFGYDENGGTRRSAIPVFFDEWFHGDFKTERPDGLSDAINGTKSLEEYADSFPDHRINSVVEIGFNTDGETIPDGEYEVQITDPDDDTTSGSLSPVTLEGGSDEPANPFRNEFDHYDDHQDDDYLTAVQKGPHTKIDDTVTVEGVDGIRGSIIFGGNDKYLEKVKEDITDLAELVDYDVPTILGLYFTHLPAFYTFLDFAFMADGSKAVRVWDASRYPAHALYVDGQKERQNTFRQDQEWTVDGPAGEDKAFKQFAIEGQIPSTNPFNKGNSFEYKTGFRVFGFGDHPVMDLIDPGSTLSVETIENELSDPLFPF